MITFNYSYCRLVSIGIVDIRLGSFNFSVHPKIGSQGYYWDAIFNQMEKNQPEVKGLKILSNRKDGKPGYISIFHQHEDKFLHDQIMPGVELISNSKKEILFLRSEQLLLSEILIPLSMKT